MNDQLTPNTAQTASEPIEKKIWISPEISELDIESGLTLNLEASRFFSPESD